MALILNLSKVGFMSRSGMERSGNKVLVGAAHHLAELGVC